MVDDKQKVTPHPAASQAASGLHPVMAAALAPFIPWVPTGEPAFDEAQALVDAFESALTQLAYCAHPELHKPRVDRARQDLVNALRRIA